MGWTYPYGINRADLIRERIAGWSRLGQTVRIVSHCLRGNCLWKLTEHVDAGGTVVDRWIALDLLQGSKKGWGYKDLDETDAPYYWSCPLSYLERADIYGPGADEHARKWRADCREVHAMKTAARIAARAGGTVGRSPDC